MSDRSVRPTGTFEMDEILKKRRRHLPHWQLGGSVYFVTFRSIRGELPTAAMKQIMTHMLYHHNRRYELHR